MSATFRVGKLTIEGVSTRYMEAGEGDAVIVFIHGGAYDYRGTNSAEDWATSMSGMATRYGYHVYAIDKLGAGETDGPATDDAYTMTSVIDHAWQTIEALGIRRCAIVGHSRGALVAARIALDHPEVTSALAVVNSNTLAAEDPAVPSDFYERPYVYSQLPTEDTITSLMTASTSTRGDAYAAALGRKVAKLRDPHPDRPHTAEAIDRVMRLTREVFLPDMVRQKNAALDRIRAGELKVPSLVFWGLNDASAPLKIGFDLYQLIGMNSPEAQMHVFNRSGHYPFLEHPEDFEDVLDAFLGRHGVSAG